MIASSGSKDRPAPTASGEPRRCAAAHSLHSVLWFARTAGTSHAAPRAALCGTRADGLPGMPNALPIEQTSRSRLQAPVAGGDQKGRETETALTVRYRALGGSLRPSRRSDVDQVGIAGRGATWRRAIRRVGAVMSGVNQSTFPSLPPRKALHGEGEKDAPDDSSWRLCSRNDMRAP